MQGRIATIVNSLRALEEADRRHELDKRRLEILEMKATGAIEIAEPDGGEEVDIDAKELGVTADETLYE